MRREYWSAQEHEVFYTAREAFSNPVRRLMSPLAAWIITFREGEPKT